MDIQAKPFWKLQRSKSQSRCSETGGFSPGVRGDRGWGFTGPLQIPPAGRNGPKSCKLGLARTKRAVRQAPASRNHPGGLKCLCTSGVQRSTEVLGELRSGEQLEHLEQLSQEKERQREVAYHSTGGLQGQNSGERWSMDGERVKKKHQQVSSENPGTRGQETPREEPYKSLALRRALLSRKKGWKGEAGQTVPTSEARRLAAGVCAKVGWSGEGRAPKMGRRGGYPESVS